MQGSTHRTPIRKPVPSSSRDEFVVGGKKYREHMEGLVRGKNEETGLVDIVRVLSFHRVRENPRRVPRDRILRTRGKHRRIAL